MPQAASHKPQVTSSQPLAVQDWHRLKLPPGRKLSEPVPVPGFEKPIVRLRLMKGAVEAYEKHPADARRYAIVVADVLGGRR